MIREALISDIPAMHVIRVAVKENRLSDPGLISPKDYEEYMTRRGKAWVYEKENKLHGFAVVDMTEYNVWALFVHPDSEGKGIGRQLHDVMLNWYFAQTRQELWLSTSPVTRAETFYRRAGWQEKGTYGKGEILFVMNRDQD